MLRNLLRRPPRAAFPGLLLRRQVHSTGFDWEDPLLLKDALTAEEIAISDVVRKYCQERVLPRVLRKLYSLL